MPGLTVCSPVAHQHPCDGPRTASPQCTEQLQEPVRMGKGRSAGVGVGGRERRAGFQASSCLVTFVPAVLPPGSPSASL